MVMRRDHVHPLPQSSSGWQFLVQKAVVFSGSINGTYETQVWTYVPHKELLPSLVDHRSHSCLLTGKCESAGIRWYSEVPCLCLPCSLRARRKAALLSSPLGECMWRNREYHLFLAHCTSVNLSWLLPDGISSSSLLPRNGIHEIYYHILMLWFGGMSIIFVMPLLAKWFFFDIKDYVYFISHKWSAQCKTRRVFSNSLSNLFSWDKSQGNEKDIAMRGLTPGNGHCNHLLEDHS